LGNLVSRKDKQLPFTQDQMDASGVLDAEGALVNPATNDVLLDIDGIYALRYNTDSVNSNLLYVGEAVVGSSDSDSVWRIMRLNSSSGEIKWAADAQFTQIYLNRESLVYS
jgi:hypothetical protein